MGLQPVKPAPGLVALGCQACMSVFALRISPWPVRTESPDKDGPVTMPESSQIADDVIWGGCAEKYNRFHKTRTSSVPGKVTSMWARCRHGLGIRVWKSP